MARLRGRPGGADEEQDDDTLPLRPANEAKDGIPLTSRKAKSSVGITALGRYNREWTVVVTDVAAVVLPLATLGLIVAIYLLDGSEVDAEAFGYWRNCHHCAFAAIIGRLSYQIARYRLEQGATTGFLEQMLGSRTFGGAVLTQFSLGTINVVGIGLVLLWAASPLGTQSMLRLLDARPFENTLETAIVHRDMMADSRIPGSYRFMNGPGQESGTNFWQSLSATMKSLVLLPENIQTDTMDMWGYVKIPFLDDGYGDDSASDPEWRDVAWSPGRERFSALAGVPVGDVPVGNTTFSLEAACVELDCYNVTALNMSEGYKEPMSWNWTGVNDWEYGGVRLDPGSHANDSWQGSPPPHLSNMPLKLPSWHLALDRFVDSLWLNESWVAGHHGLNYQDARFESKSPYLAESFSTPRLLANETGIEVGKTRLYSYFTFNPRRGAGGDSVSAYCDVRQKYVETRVRCERAASSRQNCTAVRQRPSRRRHAPVDVSFLSFPDVFHAVAGELTRTLALGDSHDYAFNYLIDPRRVNDQRPVLQEVAPADFSRRLTQLINTFLTVASFDIGSRHKDGSERSIMEPNVTVAGVNAWNTEVYHVPLVWTVLSLVTGAVFLVGGVASVVFTHLSHGPEVLGFASTVVRDSKFMELPPGADAMSSMDLAREMRYKRVRFGYSDAGEGERRVLGVGPVEEMAHIRGR